MRSPLIQPHDLPATIPQAFRAVAAVASDQIVMQMKEGTSYRRHTYRDIEDQVRGLSASLSELGVGSGHRVAIVAENRPEWAIAYLSIITVGATAVPLDIQMPRDLLLSSLTASDSRMVFMSSRTSLLLKDLLSPVSLVNMDVAEASGQLVFQDLVAQGLQKPPVDLTVKPDDVASLLYTSGTTKRPKGVLLTHRNFMTNAKALLGTGLAGPEDNFLLILPLHHAYPFMTAFLVPLLMGARITFLQTLKGPDLLQCLHETEVTMVVGVPQVFAMIRRSIFEEMNRRPTVVRVLTTGLLGLSGLVCRYTGWNLGRLLFVPIHRKFGESLRLLCSGGAKLDQQVMKDLTSVGFSIREGYGLTETSPVIAFSPLVGPKPGSVGPPVADVEVRIVNPDERGIGEVTVRGASVMKGYDRAPAETAEALRDGWFHTGDLGYLDADGFLFLTGRIKELIVTPGGKNILPDEVEAEYQQSQAIAELCIIGVPRDGEEGENLHAVVVPNFDYLRGEKIHDAAGYIKDELNRIAITLPTYKRINGITLIKDPLPRTRLGKIQRHLVIARIKSGDDAVKAMPQFSDSDQELLETETGRVVMDILKGLLPPKKEILLDDHLDLDLGFDSLKRVEFHVAIEGQLGSVPEELIAEVVTVRDVIEKLKGIEKTRHEEAEGQRPWGEILEIPPPPALTEAFLTTPSHVNRLASAMAVGFCKKIFRGGFSLAVTGMEHLPRQGPFLLASNHLSFLDPFILISVVPRSVFSKLYILGWEPYFRSRFRRWVGRVGHVIPVGPQTGLVTVLRTSSAVLRAGKSLLIFPEGERSIDGHLQPFKKGIGVLACELGVPVFPVRIEGSFQAWPPDAKRPHSHPLRVVFGEPILIRSSMTAEWISQGQDPHEAAANVIRDAIIASP